jgi:ADP-heptose:LPS heptosyltransferase/2-polyprenyl-3-methyl-5-hydroxy-6-metoxy-1,4-benzoquinol methylase/glycosyltransferase involved in cell wall biosynthesis
MEISRPHGAAQQTRRHDAAGSKLRILMIYSLHPVNPRVTIPEWIKESFRQEYADEIEVFACGPRNEIDIPDTPDFYDKVAQVVQQLDIDVLWDIEAGADSTDFIFKRLPKNFPIPTVFWAIDSHQFLPLQAEKARYFDLVFSAQKSARPHLGAHAQWLPVGASLHEIDYQLERTIDVGFVGNIFPGLHERRRQVIARLTREIPGFSHFSNVFFEDKARLTSSMKIMVNVSLSNDVNLRVFETMACGALLITDRLYDNGLEELFEDGKHLVTFETEEELVQKIRYYLCHDDERIAIARAGQQRVLSTFTHKHIIGHALHFMRKLVAERARELSPAARERRCWCGGALRPSVHPLYGRCEQCDTQVVWELLSAEQLREFYTMNGYWHEYQNVLANFPTIEERSVNDFHDRIPVWHQLLARYNPSPERLLEIGCSHGGFLSYARQHGAKDVVGVEVDETTCAFARSRFDLPHVVSGLFPDIELPFQNFDMITGFDVIEHFRDPLQGMQAVADHLTDDGMFIFQTPCYRGESASWAQFKAEEHLFLYNEQSVRLLFERCGLTVTEILPGYFRDDMFVIGRKSRPVQNILYLRPDSIGDNVMGAAMLPHIKERYPQAHITVLCQQHIAEIYEACPQVSRVIGFNRLKAYENESYRELILRQLQGVGADLALNTLYSREPLYDLFAIGCGAVQRVAFNGNLSNIPRQSRDQNNQYYTRIIADDPAPKTELERHREYLAALGIAAAPLAPVIWTTAEDERSADEFFAARGLDPEKTIALYACGQWGEKIYPHYGAALSAICAREGLTVIALGSARDAEVNQGILAQIGAPSCNLAGGTSIRQGAAILRRCRLAVGADTGTAHIANAVGTPNVVILGGGHFGRFQPYSQLSSIVSLPLACYQCNWNCSYERAHCMRDIHPGVLATAVREALAQRSDKPRVYLQAAELWHPGPGEPAWQDAGGQLDPESVQITMVGRQSALSAGVTSLPPRQPQAPAPPAGLAVAAGGTQDPRYLQQVAAEGR